MTKNYALFMVYCSKCGHTFGDYDVCGECGPEVANRDGGKTIGRPCSLKVCPSCFSYETEKVFCEHGLNSSHSYCKHNRMEQHDD